ncbi:uncharacterized protein LOC105216424 [Zeugodacus cucurbitae]|uniref:uncharacterized protein LOC105216424 n=1 Tax=Zeugodacus cucurbitae TaxID=28588 RepID=UPI000596ACEA|nr:uncharacterized protein LOC105216424 [Zeugodacus cucurbitae]
MSSEIDIHVRIHYQKEEETLRQLLKLEELFREHLALTKREMLLQKDMVNRLWVLSQRYVILISTTGCCKHPEVYSGPTEDILLREYSDKLNLLRTSNCRISDSLRKLRQQCILFNSLHSLLDLTMETPFIIGDTFHKPIAYFVELVDDLFKYLHALSVKLKYLSHQLEPVDLLVLEEYKAALEPSEDFDEYLLVGLSYCKCLRPKQVCQ